MHDVAVGDDILLAFQPQLAGVARTRLAAVRHRIIVGDGLGANEVTLEVGVDAFAASVPPPRSPLLMLWTAPPPARECHGCGCC